MHRLRPPTVTDGGSLCPLALQGSPDPPGTRHAPRMSPMLRGPGSRGGSLWPPREYFRPRLRGAWAVDRGESVHLGSDQARPTQQAAPRRSGEGEAPGPSSVQWALWTPCQMLSTRQVHSPPPQLQAGCAAHTLHLRPYSVQHPWPIGALPRGLGGCTHPLPRGSQWLTYRG